MKKMKKYLMLLVLPLLLVLLPNAAYADHSDAPRVVDNTGTLSDEDFQEITDDLQDIAATYDLDIVLFLESATPEEYADNYGDDNAMYYCADLYDYGGYTDNGLALLITVDERKWALVTEGEGDSLFNDNVQDRMSGDFLPYLRDSDFTGACKAYVSYAKYILTSYSDDGTDSTDDVIYTYDGSGGLAVEWLLINKPLVLAISLILGLLVALIRNAKLKGELKSVRANNMAANYVVQDSLVLRKAMDTYLYTTETRTRREREDNSSSSFTSSSGDSHTGSSGSF